jgi:DNA phosphorothioation-associated putative methyltransferase
MKLDEFRQHVESIPFGKRLPSALYVYRDGVTSFGEKLDLLLAQVTKTCGVSSVHNVIKFRLDELKVSFLSYPTFFEDPHPALQHAITVDLVTWKARHTAYEGNHNPPILHRKESFLPPDHPKRAEFEALTKAEEQAGLYEETSTIGFKLNWERLLTAKGVILEGHTLRRTDAVEETNVDAGGATKIHRHKTALTRYDLSKPVKTLVEYGLLKQGVTFFDYGCGQGSDVSGLRALGHEAEGWDPVHRPNVHKRSAHVVNLGYVLNVIEDAAERLDSLVDAYRHTERLLVVSGLIQETVDAGSAAIFRDGVLTKRNTFQKYFDQRELQQYIEDALEVTAVPVGLGIFYVFRDPVEQQDFLSARTRRAIDWNQISSRLGLGRPPVREARVRVRVDFYEQHKELLDAFWAEMLQLGRLPIEEEFPRFKELRETVGSPKRAERLFIARGGQEALEKARESRRNDLLAYLGISNLRKPVPQRHLSAGLKTDIKTFFGDYGRALKLSRELLFAAGDPGEIEVACEGLGVGWQDEQALYFHRSLLDKLPPLLRVFVGCAAVLYGDVNQADIIKLHKASGKVTFLIYDDFAGKHLPELQQRIKVDLRSHFVQVFDHSKSGQPLYLKERSGAPEPLRRPDVKAFSA